MKYHPLSVVDLARGAKINLQLTPSAYYNRTGRLAQLVLVGIYAGVLVATLMTESASQLGCGGRRSRPPQPNQSQGAGKSEMHSMTEFIGTHFTFGALLLGTVMPKQTGLTRESTMNQFNFKTLSFYAIIIAQILMLSNRVST